MIAAHFANDENVVREGAANESDDFDDELDEFS